MAFHAFAPPQRTKNLREHTIQQPAKLDIQHATSMTVGCSSCAASSRQRRSSHGRSVLIRKKKLCLWPTPHSTTYTHTSVLQELLAWLASKLRPRGPTGRVTLHQPQLDSLILRELSEPGHASKSSNFWDAFLAGPIRPRLASNVAPTPPPHLSLCHASDGTHFGLASRVYPVPPSAIRLGVVSWFGVTRSSRLSQCTCITEVLFSDHQAASSSPVTLMFTVFALLGLKIRATHS